MCNFEQRIARFSLTDLNGIEMEDGKMILESKDIAVNTEPNYSAYGSEAVGQPCSRGGTNSTDSISGIDPKPVVSDLVLDVIDCDDVRAEVFPALGKDDASHLRKVTFLKIGQTVVHQREDSQLLIDRFVLRRSALEEWACNFGLSVACGYLQPVGDMYSAIFELESAR